MKVFYRAFVVGALLGAASAVAVPIAVSGVNGDPAAQQASR